MYLRPAGNSSFDEVLLHVVGDFVFELFPRHGPLRAQATIDISPLSTLTNCGSSSRLVAQINWPKRVVALAADAHYTPAFSVSNGHGAELEHFEGFAVQPSTLLSVEHGARRTELHADGEQQHDRADEGEDNQRQHLVLQPFDQLVHARHGRGGEVVHGHADDIADPMINQTEGKQIRHKAYGGGAVAQGVQRLSNRRFVG